MDCRGEAGEHGDPGGKGEPGDAGYFIMEIKGVKGIKGPVGDQGQFHRCSNSYIIKIEKVSCQYRSDYDYIYAHICRYEFNSQDLLTTTIIFILRNILFKL